MNISSLTFGKLAEKYDKLFYSFFTGPYNVNLFGIRSSDPLVDEFNDFLGVAFQDQFGRSNLLIHEGTTKPGLYWLKNKKGNLNGTAILQPDQYVNCWKIGKHKGQYEALVQNGNQFRVWRDNDADGELDYGGPTFRDVTGLNMHTESLLTQTEKVGAYSAGCQVRKYDREHFMVMELLKRSAELWGDGFSYTLFDDTDFD